MTPPNTPHGPSSDDEQDHTGVRDLLASLPAPGPMPDDVMRNISAALAEEQQKRSGEHGNVSPLVGRAESRSDDDAHERSSDRRGVTWLRPLAAVGAAAAIGIGALVGFQSLSGDNSAPVANAPSETESAAPADLVDRVAVQNTGRDYTRTGLATEAAALKDPPASATKAAREGAQDVTKLNSARGVISCMKKIIGSSVPDSISADVGRYEGQPAVVVVVTEGDKSQAWVVSRTCSDGKGKIAGPTAVT